jgi:hypothetical protein
MQVWIYLVKLLMMPQSASMKCAVLQREVYRMLLQNSPKLTGAIDARPINIIPQR